MSLAIFHPHFVIRIFPSAFYYPHFSIPILSSAFFYPPSAIRSALYRDPNSNAYCECIVYVQAGTCGLPRLLTPIDDNLWVATTFVWLSIGRCQLTNKASIVIDWSDWSIDFPIIGFIDGFRQNTDPRSTDPLLTPLWPPYWPPIKSMGKWKLKKAQNYQCDPIQVHQ